MLAEGVIVQHAEFGLGKVVRILGDLVSVEFYGDMLDVRGDELTPTPEAIRRVSANEPPPTGGVPFRRALEALNLGVVPPDPGELIEFTIGGHETAQEVKGWLDRFPEAGLCKAVFGNYGTGKSHFLRLVEAIALQAGWVVSLLEFDPKAADPAKPHLVYRGLANNLRFPPREDGSQISDFEGLIYEVRKHWDRVSSGLLFRNSPWFRPALETLRFYARNQEEDYGSACSWLGGADVPLSVIRGLARAAKVPDAIPRLPRMRETADIYVHHLAVLAEICRNLGYGGLLLVLDEAEHVRGFNVRRQERANNLFDVLARSAHYPMKAGGSIIPNDHGVALGPYWNQGPHFALVVGLTEGDVFADKSVPLHDACVFLHNKSDRKMLKPPSPAEYEAWCEHFLRRFCEYRPTHAAMLDSDKARRAVAAALRVGFEKAPLESRVLRRWLKLACLVPSVLMAGNAATLEELIAILDRAALELGDQLLPWDDLVG